MRTRGLLFRITVILTLKTCARAQGYGDVEVPIVTTAPVLIDCGTPPSPQAIQLPTFPTLPPLQPIQFPTLPPPQKIPSFSDLFPTSSYATGPPTTTQGYNQAPPQLQTIPPPKIPTFNELFPSVAPTNSEVYAQPKIDYVPVVPSAPSYQTAPQPFTFPPLPKMPTFADLFSPTPSAPIAPKQQPIAISYEVGPPAAKPEEPYSSNVEDEMEKNNGSENENNEENMEGDEVLLQPVENENSPVIMPDQPLQINPMPIKTSKFESTKVVVQKSAPPSPQKIQKMMDRKHKVNGVKTVMKEIQLGTSHHVDAHNHHRNPHRH